jgi:hypothetical protein
MQTIISLYQKVQTLEAQTDQLITSSLEQTKEALIDQNREQLLAGKTRDGKDLSPTYLEDPYFKSQESAQRYSDWKDRITPNPNRVSGVPNLFINGYLHSSMGVKISGQNLFYSASASFGNKVEQKFTDKIYGLGGVYKMEYLNESLGPVFRQSITSIIGLKFNKV